MKIQSAAGLSGRDSTGPRGGPALDSRDMNSSTASATSPVVPMGLLARPCACRGALRRRDLDSKRPYDGGPLGRSTSDAYLVITATRR
jgi:hypothetical protein